MIQTNHITLRLKCLTKSTERCLPLMVSVSLNSWLPYRDSRHSNLPKDFEVLQLSSLASAVLVIGLSHISLPTNTRIHVQAGRLMKKSKDLTMCSHPLHSRAASPTLLVPHRCPAYHLFPLGLDCSGPFCNGSLFQLKHCKFLCIHYTGGCRVAPLPADSFSAPLGRKTNYSRSFNSGNLM